MIAGLEPVTSGEIYFGDRLINHLEPCDRDVAMVFQNYSLYPNMTVRENMSFGLRMRKTSKSEIERRVSEVARILSIENLLARRPKELSGGQCQRVAVGRAIVRQPQAFLFDEPLSNLDSILRVQMRTELARLHQHLRTTTVYVTHDQAEAMTLADRIAVMQEGVIQQIDTPLNVYRNPANKFVAGFIGSPAMNFVPGIVQNGVFTSGDLAYPLNPGHSSATSPIVDGPVEFGCRPESFTMNGADPLFAKVRIDIVEPLGHETIIYFQLASQSLVGRLKGTSDLRSDDMVSLHLPAGEWHLFSASENEQKQQVHLLSGASRLKPEEKDD
jgi:multiple sugar transport system ATP-binding protein